MSVAPLHERGAQLQLPPQESSWGVDEVILYHLGIGAGVPTVDGRELAYLYEPCLKVQPSFAVIPGTCGLHEAVTSPLLDLDIANLLHGEHELELDGPVPTAADATTTLRVADVFDKGTAALVVIEAETRDATGARLFLNRFRIFVRGGGGFGGDPGPSGPSRAAPERPPDLCVERPTEERQGLLYRLSGDKNPLHADPDFARRAGFDRPILHGLCTYGIACKTAIDEVLQGDVSRVSHYAVRFAGIFFPGETLVVELWQEHERIALRASAKERGVAVLTHAEIRTR